MDLAEPLADRSSPEAPPVGSQVAASPLDVTRFRALVDGQYDFIWRSLRRLGVPAASVDDAAQQVFFVLSTKLAAVPQGAERTFLFRTAMGVAANLRRSARVHQREEADAAAIDHAVADALGPEELLRMKQARLVLDDILDAMEEDYRAVFVLAEIEGMTVPAIAQLLDLAGGTAASRLRRAREIFQDAVARFQAREKFGVAMESGGKGPCPT